MNAAAPEGTPPRRFNNREHFYKTRNCPAVPREGPWGGEPSYLRFSWFRWEPTWCMPGYPEQINSYSPFRLPN